MYYIQSMYYTHRFWLTITSHHYRPTHTQHCKRLKKFSLSLSLKHTHTHTHNTKLISISLCLLYPSLNCCRRRRREVAAVPPPCSSPYTFLVQGFGRGHNLPNMPLFFPNFGPYIWKLRKLCWCAKSPPVQLQLRWLCLPVFLSVYDN